VVVLDAHRKEPRERGRITGCFAIDEFLSRPERIVGDFPAPAPAPDPAEWGVGSTPGRVGS
jgi:hypothetical protein